MHVEVEAAAEDVVSQQTKLLGLLDGDGEPVHGHGVLGADIDVALGGAGGHARDDHALDDLVRIALHAGAVHECAGVALVAVADDVLDGLFRMCRDLRPLAPGREARAAAAAQAGIAHGLDDLVRLHLEQGLGQRAVAADGQVLFDGFRVDMAAVLEHAAGLLFVKRDVFLALIQLAVLVIAQALDELAAEDGLLNDLVAVLKPDVRVKEALRLDLKQRPHFAEAVAAALFEVDGVVSALMAQRDARFQPALFTLGLQVVVDLQRAARNAARARADKDLAPVRREQLLGLYAQSAEPFSRQFSHLQRPPLHECPQAAQALFRDPSSRVPRRRSS